MILNDHEDPAIEATADNSASTAEQRSLPVFVQVLYLFKRDIWCWINAIQKMWWLFILAPLLFACATFFFRTMTTTNVYVANCGLIRQSVDTRDGVLPPGYTNVQKSIILNLFKTRAVLEETIKRLSLPYSSEQLYNNITINVEKNSDYYIISASSKDPTISAALANTMADVFIEEYKKLIRRNLEDLNDSYVRTQNEMEKMLAELDEKLKKLNAENNLTTIENDIAFNNQRLLQIEDQLTRSSSSLDSAKQALFELQGELVNTPEEIVSKRVTSTAVEDELLHAENLLLEYEQIYARNNPLLIQQREIVKKLKTEKERLKQEEEEGSNEINKHVEVSLNPAYTQIQVAIAAKKAEISSLTNDIKLNNDNAVQLRARRELLAALQPTLRQLETDIQQTKSQLNNTKVQITTINSFLSRSFSDISIQELAKTPKIPLGRKRGIWTIVGFILGTFLACAITFACELFNLTIRSNVDIEQALGIRMLGMIPLLDQKHRADYYSALQTMTSNGKLFFSHASPEHPGLIVFAPDKRTDQDEKILEEFCETLKVRTGNNYVVISPIKEEDFSMKQMPLLINDYLYQFTDTAPKPGKDHRVFFRLDDLSFVSPLSDEQVQRVRNAYQSKSISLIIWDLFEFEQHRQLFAEIARNADLTVIPMKYAQTSKVNVFRILQFLRSFQVKNIFGFLHNVNNKHYSKVTL